jgi:hypothetical protein
MDHVNSMLKCYSHDVLLAEIRSNGGQPLSNEVRLIRLVSVRTHSVFIRVDGDSRHSQFVRGSEDTDGNLTTIGYQDLLEWARMTCLFGS